MVGEFYIQNRNYACMDVKDLRARLYEVIAETVTHVYIRNIRTRYSFNVDKESFSRDYMWCKSQEKHTL